MDPATVVCPNLVCPARGHPGASNSRIHSHQDQRFLCPECHQTFRATQGTAFYRRRTAAETVSRVVTLLAHGCPLPAMVVAFGVDERTVASWAVRAGLQGQAVQEHLVEQPRDWGQVQGEESRVKPHRGMVRWHGSARFSHLSGGELAGDVPLLCLRARLCLRAAQQDQ
jgi:transposase-like protein